MRKSKGVVAAAPFVLTQALMRKEPGTYTEGRFGRGNRARRASAAPEVTTIREHAIEGDFRFESTDGKHRGAVVGSLLANRMSISVGHESSCSSRRSARR